MTVQVAVLVDSELVRNVQTPNVGIQHESESESIWKVGTLRCLIRFYVIYLLSEFFFCKTSLTEIS